mmetsp:Transcript_117677/g.333507  ORF Transcript_117677/g.333507 Transcript_117677/m.333507 type:complete len:85 (-) Transcript_117677:219-473(-)
MRSVSNKTAQMLFNVIQVLLLTVFVGAVSYAVASMEAATGTPQLQQLSEKSCVTHKTWLILPFAFLTGGLMNIDGFASTAALLL